jgi:hypothetical protein
MSSLWTVNLPSAVPVSEVELGDLSFQQARQLPDVSLAATPLGP